MLLLSVSSSSSSSSSSKNINSNIGIGVTTTTTTTTTTTLKPLITDTAEEFQFCPLEGVFVSSGRKWLVLRLCPSYIRSGWRDTHSWPQPPSPSELLAGPLYSSLSL
jgi:hypothetical protein